MSDNKNEQLKKENAELRAQIAILASNSSFFSTESSSDEIDLSELWKAMWSGKWFIVVTTFIFAVASVFYALSLPDEYKSTAILAPASQSSGAGLSKLAGQFGGLASLAGININGGGAEDKSVIAMEIIKTWGFLEKFIEDNRVQVEVFAAKGWNRSTNKLIIDSDIYDSVNKKWVREFDSKTGKAAEPSSWELFEKIRNRINISQDKTSSLVTLSVEHYSPGIAKKWTDKLVVAINQYIQEKDKKEALKSIQYLQEKINETKVADMQTVFYQLIEEQTKNLMLAEVSDEYVFKTLSGSKVAEQKSKPKRALICILSIILGLMLSAIITLILHFYRKNKL